VIYQIHLFLGHAKVVIYSLWLKFLRYDEAIGKLRDEYGLDLSDVFNAEDLIKEFEKLNAPDRPDSKQALIDNAQDFFGNPTSKEVQKEVKKNFERKIAEADTIDKLNKIPNLPTGILFKDVDKIEKSIDDQREDIFSETIGKSKKPSAEASELAEKTGLSREEVLSTVREEIFSSDKRLLELGGDINRQQIEDANLDALKSIEKFSGKLGISEDDGREVLVREGFTLFFDDKKFKK